MVKLQPKILSAKEHLKDDIFQQVLNVQRQLVGRMVWVTFVQSRELLAEQQVRA